MPLNDELFSQLEKLNTYDVNQLLNEDSIKDVPMEQSKLTIKMITYKFN